MPKIFQPAYIERLTAQELKRRIQLAWEQLKDCDLCARYCRVNRLETLHGAVCRTGERAIVHSYGPHHGEEDPLRGWNGSGTIFFSGCNLRCIYCQNWDISQRRSSDEVSSRRLAAIMLHLQAQGCHNINLVTPSHSVAQLLAAVEIAAQAGLRLPLVYNTGGYDSPQALALLENVIDIYMPDMKYGNSAIAHRYSHVRDYAEINQAAVREMHRQVGDLVLDAQGIAQRGLLIRHLVLPNDLANTEKVLGFIAREISLATYLNIMAQYHPCYRADDYPELNRAPTRTEYRNALTLARRYGLQRLDQHISWR